MIGWGEKVALASFVDPKRVVAFKAEWRRVVMFIQAGDACVRDSGCLYSLSSMFLPRHTYSGMLICYFMPPHRFCNEALRIWEEGYITSCEFRVFVLSLSLHFVYRTGCICSMLTGNIPRARRESTISKALWSSFSTLSEYDKLLKESETACLFHNLVIPLPPSDKLSSKFRTKSLVLFERIIHSRWFLHTSILVFVNNINNVKSKLPNVYHWPLPPILELNIFSQILLAKYLPDHWIQCQQSGKISYGTLGKATGHG